MGTVLVLADDLTGATELGGIALRFGLQVRICHNLIQNPQTDVVIQNTNNRALHRGEVLKNLEDLFKDFDCQCYDFVYLKFDSALRGFIDFETSWYLKKFKRQKLLFCPINPLLKRVIQNGVYLIDGVPIHETSFKDDPEFPIQFGEIDRNLGGEWLTLPVENLNGTQGKIIIEADDFTDLKKLAKLVAPDTLFAGAGAFFTALLEDRYQSSSDQQKIIPKPDIIICGSTHDQSREWLKAQDENVKVVWDGLDYEIVYRLIAIKRSGRIPVFAYSDVVEGTPKYLRHRMGHVISLFLEACPCNELFIEGGSTASAILKILGIDTLIPEQEILPGLVRSKIPDLNLYISMKPGSYSWGNIAF